MVREIESEFHVFELIWNQVSKLDSQIPGLQEFIKHRSESQKASSDIDAPSLRKILEYMPKIYSPYLSEIESIESKVEMQLLSVVPSAIDYLSELREKNYKIAFISDMHISSTSLRPKLESLGLCEPADELLVSSDVGFSKSRGGKLFRYFLETNNLKAINVTHYGNSFWSDVRMARKQGVSAAYTPDFNLNRYESLVKGSISDQTAADHLVFNSKLTRMNSYNSDGANVFTDTRLDKKVISNIASSVAAPVLYFFVLWVLKECREQSISTIRFLTRDGEIFKAIADELPPELTDGLNMQLLEVSRNSLVLPTASVVPIDDWIQAGFQPGSFLIQHYDRLPAQHLFKRAGLCIHKDFEILRNFGLTEGEVPLGRDGLEKWKRALSSQAIQNRVLESSKSRLNAVSAYLQQNIGLESGDKVALVDVGWTGQQAAMLGALIQEKMDVSSVHLHIGRLRKYPLLNEADIKGWLFDESDQRPSPIPNPVALFESFLATTSGGVDSYKQDENGHWIATRRSQQHTQALKAWGQETVIRSIVEFAKSTKKTNLSSDEQLKLSKILLEEFWCNPTYEEGRFWGDFPYEQDQSGKNIAKLAKRYSILSVVYKLLGKKQEVDWKAGSLQTTAAPLRELIEIFDKLKASLKSN